MKKINILIFILLFPFTLFSSEWKFVEKLFGYVSKLNCTTTDCCYSIHKSTFTTELYKSIDQGKSWQHIFNYTFLDETRPLLITPKFASVPHSDYIFINYWDVSDLLVSTDAGISFNRIKTVEDNGITNFVSDFIMLDSNIGVIGNYAYHIFLTFDGWKSYEYRLTPKKIDSFELLDTLGYPNSLYTLPIFKDNENLHLIFTNNTMLLLVNYNINTEEWTFLYNFEKDSAHHRQYTVEKIIYVNDTLGFMAASRLIDIGDSRSDIVFRTIDGGYNWSKVLDSVYTSSPWGWGIWDIDFYDERNGMAVSKYGTVYLTNDGGDSWLRDEWDGDVFKREGDDTYGPVVMFGQFAGQFPIIGTRMGGNMYRYEGNFFIFDFKAPDLFFPKANTVKHDTDILFRWEELKDATSYTYQLSTDENFNNILLEHSANEMNIPYEGLELFTEYYWRVSSTNGAETLWSPTYTFRTRMPNISTLSPDCNAVEQAKDITLQWTSVKGAEQYRIRLATDPAFENILLETDGIIETEYPLTNLGYSKTYYWQVQASRSDERGDWSDVCSFTIESGVGVNDTEHSNFISIEQSKTHIKFNINNENIPPKEIVINIYSLNGTLLNELNSQLSSGQNTYEINISNEPSGTYIYVISADGIPMKSDKFLIVK